MKMLKALFVALAATVVFSCSQDGKKYVVKGIAPADGVQVYLLDQITGKPIDSTVVTNGAFVMKGVAEKDALLNVRPAAPGPHWNYFFINDGVPVKVNFADSTLVGSEENTKLMESCRQIHKAYSTFARYAENYRALPEEERAAKKEERRAEFNKWADCYKHLFEENRDNNVSVGLMALLRSYIPRDTYGELLSSEGTFKNHPYVIDVQRKRDEAAAKEKARQERKQSCIGKPFLELQEADPDGKMHSLSEYAGKGKWVLVDFWASWCGPCKREMPNVVAAYKKYHKKGFEIVGISFDDKKEDWVKAIKEWEMPWIHLSDLKGWYNAAHEVYAVDAIPDNILIDPKGVVVTRDLRGADLEKKLDELFK